MRINVTHYECVQNVHHYKEPERHEVDIVSQKHKWWSTHSATCNTGSLHPLTHNCHQQNPSRISCIREISLVLVQRFLNLLLSTTISEHLSEKSPSMV